VPRVISVTYLANIYNYCPIDAPCLRERIESLIGVKPVIVRVSSREIHLYTPAPLRDEKKRTLWRRFAPPSTLRDPPCLQGGASRVLCKYEYFMILERYWEAHEAGEGLWRMGFPGGQLLAVVAGVLAKAQEGDSRAVEIILDRVLPVVVNGQAGVGVPFDPIRLRGEAYQVLACSPGTVPLLTLNAPLLSHRKK